MNLVQAGAAPEPADHPGQNRRGWRRLFAGKFLVISIAAHLLFAAGAAVWVVQTIHAQRKLTFTSAPPSPNPATRALEHQVQLAKRKNTMSAPAMAKRITTTAISKVSLPDMPTMPKLSALAPTTRMAGMGGTGMGIGFGGFGAGSGMGAGGGGIFTSSIGGLKIKSQRLAVALDVSGSVKAYHDAMQSHVEKTFKGSEVGEFKSAGFYEGGGKGKSMGSVVLDFLNSPKKFDAIYIFSDFGETEERHEQTQWAEVQKLVNEKKVRLYLHVLREPGKEGKINPVLAEVIAFAKKTGGSVKIGPMKEVSEAGGSE